MTIFVLLPVVAVSVVSNGGMRDTEIRPVHRPKNGSGLSPEFFPEQGQCLPIPPPVCPSMVDVGEGNLKMALATESEESAPLMVRGTLRGSAAVIAQYTQFEIGN